MPNFNRQDYWMGEQDKYPDQVDAVGRFQAPPLGFLLELSLMLVVATAVPDWVPGLMGFMWPETLEA